MIVKDCPQTDGSLTFWIATVYGRGDNGESVSMRKKINRLNWRRKNAAIEEVAGSNKSMRWSSIGICYRLPIPSCLIYRRLPLLKRSDRYERATCPNPQQLKHWVRHRRWPSQPRLCPFPTEGRYTVLSTVSVSVLNTWVLNASVLTEIASSLAVVCDWSSIANLRSFPSNLLPKSFTEAPAWVNQGTSLSIKVACCE